MKSNRSISLSKTNYLSQLSKDYLLGNDIGISNPRVTQYSQLIEKAHSKDFNTFQRKGLVDTLLRQYESDGIDLNEKSNVFQNIVSLNDINTYTITTGQQIHLFLGPLFFLHKIHSLLGHVKNVNASASHVKTIPIFWMATEDHDLEEINYVKLYSEKYKWDAIAGNAVGRLYCDGLPQLIDRLEQRADKTLENKTMFDLFRQHYSEGKALSSATRGLLNALFGDEGLIILNPDDAYFKQQFLKVAKQEIEGNVLFNTYNEANKILKHHGYKPRVNAQEINYFWLYNSERLKISDHDGFKLNDTPKTPWSIEQLNLNSGQLSPNVITRPLYQETILPNIAYIGGSAEIDYWLPLQSAFDRLGIQFPALLLRDSSIYLTNKNLDSIEKVGLEWEHLFLSEPDISEIYNTKNNEDANKLKADLNTISQTLQSVSIAMKELNSTESLKIINDLQKGAQKLSALLTQEDLVKQKADLQIGKVYKIKERFFDTKQEREDFCLNYPQLLHKVFSRGEKLEAELSLHIQ